MGKLTTGQVANRLNISTYTLKRWYQFWENLKATDIKELDRLIKEGMPILPDYIHFGNRGDRIWDEEDITDLEAFKNWVPATKNGIFKKYINKEDK